MAVPLAEIVILAIVCSVGTGSAAYYALKRLKAAEEQEQGDIELQCLHRDDDADVFDGHASHGDVYLPQCS